jgi:glycosyltransferase involved in cell wall biosynthesis
VTIGAALSSAASSNVYCRSHHITIPILIKGMRLVKLPTIANKYLDTIVHSFISSLHALAQGYDIALYFIAGNSPVTWIPHLAGAKTILNVDGLDWKREKWPFFAKKYIQFAEYLATKLPNAFITDSRVVQAYYLNRFGLQPPFIPYGSEVEIVPPGNTLAQYGLEPRKYMLFVGRLVPENCAHHLVEAFQGLNRLQMCHCRRCAICWEYIASLRERSGSAGHLHRLCFGKGYCELGSKAPSLWKHPSRRNAPSAHRSNGVGIVLSHTILRKPGDYGRAGFAYDGKTVHRVCVAMCRLLSSSG